MGSDNTVVDAARVSFDKQSKDYTKEQNEKLIRYLAEHEHYSPFGHCFASFHVKAPIFVARQLVKHEYLRWNEISRRYVDTEPEFLLVDTWRGRPKDKKQGSFGSLESSDLDSHLDFVHMVALREYTKLIEKGVAPEQARMVLPQSTYTEWYWSGSLDAFANMYNLRSKPDAQEETRVIADQIGKEMECLYPVSWASLTHVGS